MNAWSLPNLSGSRAGVLKAIAANDKVPPAARDYLTALINELPTEMNFIKLDAHFSGSPTLFVLDLALRPSVELI